MTANGTAIRTIREARGISLRDLAAKAGVSFGFLAQIERGEREPKPVTLQALADAVGAPLEAITKENAVTTAIEDADLRLYDAKQVAALWGISKSWLQKAAAARAIECTYLTLPGNSKGLLRFSEAQVRAILANFTVQPVNTPAGKTRLQPAA